MSDSTGVIQLRSMDEWAEFLSGPRKRPEITSKQIRIVDLFSSVGGLTTGVCEALLDSGFSPKPVLAADVDKTALEVFKANWPSASTFHGSVRNLVDSHVTGVGPSARFSYPPILIDPCIIPLKGKVDILIAGPPCQGHSSLNNVSRGDDSRNELYLQVPAIAVALGVEKIIIENVPGVVRSKENVVDTTASILESAGYNVSTAVLTADRLGWPQTRKRFFLVADLIRKPIDLLELQNELGREVPAQDLMWAIGDLQGSQINTDLMNTPATLSDENQRRAKVLYDNDLYDLPLLERPDCHKNGTTYTASYGRMKPDKAAPTITTGFLSPGRGRFLHPHLVRTLTPREAARVQGFPDWYEFNPHGTSLRVNLSKWIGDAVPPIMGYVAAKSLGF
jgi:DNA (cytosine-5)-methyltransferase 1